MTFNESMTFDSRLYKPLPLKPLQYSVNSSADSIKDALYTIKTNSKQSLLKINKSSNKIYEQIQSIKRKFLLIL